MHTEHTHANADWVFGHRLAGGCVCSLKSEELMCDGPVKGRSPLKSLIFRICYLFWLWGNFWGICLSKKKSGEKRWIIFHSMQYYTIKWLLAQQQISLANFRCTYVHSWEQPAWRKYLHTKCLKLGAVSSLMDKDNDGDLSILSLCTINSGKEWTIGSRKWREDTEHYTHTIWI